jgi:serine/threonine protein kinase
MPLASGMQLGPYKIVAPIGAGGMGEVYRAADPRLGREVALKVLPAELYRDESVRTRFEQEARAASALNHPNIVSIFDIGQDNGALYIVTELVEGESLRQAISRGSMPPRRLMEIAQQIADGLVAAHAAGVIHRDLKPENILITRDGRVKIIDFGLAKQLFSGAGSASAMTLTMPGAVMGTIGYMSPEQIRSQNVDQRTDIFSLGIILYEMAAGKSAFTGASAPDVMSSILREDPPQLQSAELPPGLPFIVDRCLKKDPTNRFQTASDLAFAIRNLSGIDMQARTSAKPARRSFRWLAWSVPVLLIAAGGAYWKLRPASAPQQSAARQPAADSAVSPLPKTVSPPAAPQPPSEKNARNQTQKAAVPAAVSPRAEPPPVPKTAADKTVPASKGPAVPALEPPDPGASPDIPVPGVPQLNGNKHWVQAENAFTKLIQMMPNNPSGYLGRARAEVQLGKLDNALEDYDQAIRLRPTAVVYSDRGRLYNQRREYQRAVEDFDEAIRLNPKLRAAYEGRAFARASLGDRRGAAEDRREAAGLRRNQ